MMFRPKIFKKENLALLSYHLSSLLQSGLPLIASIDFLVEQKLLPLDFGKKLILFLEEGLSLAAALKKLHFPSFFVSFICISEEYGDYVLGLKQCYKYYSSHAKWLRELKQACIYPFFVLFLVIIALFFMILIVLPKFDELYKTMDLTLPFLTLFLLTLFNYFSYFLWSFLLLSIFLIVVILCYKAFVKKKLNLDGILLKIPFLKKYYIFNFNHYFSLQLGFMLKAGIPLLKALELLCELTHFSKVKDSLQMVKAALLKGESFARSLLKSKFMLVSLTKMVALGEKIGSLDDILLNYAANLEILIKNGINKFTTNLEPFLIFVVGGFIAFIVIVLFLPMLQLVKAL